MRELAAQLGVADRVLFAGVQNNVPDYMNAFDLFLLPSNFEGSPVTWWKPRAAACPAWPPPMCRGWLGDRAGAFPAAQRPV